jgi:phytoene dehydrogenase-like protein
MAVHDLVIVGGGPAGVGTAYHLRDSGLDVLVLEARSEVGGRTRSVQLPGGATNTGALFVYRGTPSEELATELGLAAVPFAPRTYGIAMEGRTSIGVDPDSVVDGLPLAPEDAAALLSTLTEAVAEYRANTEAGKLAESSEALAGQTVAERLRELPERARRVVETAVQGGSVGRTGDLSAQYALRYFASYVALEKANRLLLVDGMQGLVTGMAARLAEDTIRLSTRVESVVQGSDGTWTVTAEGPDGRRIRSARQVLLAVPAPLVGELAPDLPAAKRKALATAATPGSTTMIVAADVAGLEEHRDWAFVTTVGARFDCIINPAPGPQTFRTQPDGAEIVHFVCYGNSAGYRPDLATDLAPESAERDAWVEDFLTVAPALHGRIRAVHVQTWEHCFAVLSPARAAAVGELRRPVDGLHFAGDWSSPTAGTHGALAEARRVADAVLTGRELQ